MCCQFICNRCGFLNFHLHLSHSAVRGQQQEFAGIKTHTHTNTERVKTESESDTTAPNEARQLTKATSKLSWSQNKRNDTTRHDRTDSLTLPSTISLAIFGSLPLSVSYCLSLACQLFKYMSVYVYMCMCAYIFALENIALNTIALKIKFPNWNLFERTQWERAMSEKNVSMSCILNSRLIIAPA